MNPEEQIERPVGTRLTRAELRRMKIALRLLIVATALAFGLAAWAIYLPIFKLGAAV